MVPPVSTQSAVPRLAWASTSRTISRAATACANRPGSACTTTLVSLKPVSLWSVRVLDRAAVGAFDVGPVGALGQGRIVPGVHPGGRPLAQPGAPGGGGQRGGVRLVGVEPAQLLGQLLAERAVGQRQDPVRQAGAAHPRGAVVAGDLGLGA